MSKWRKWQVAVAFTLFAGGATVMAYPSFEQYQAEQEQKLLKQQLLNMIASDAIERDATIKPQVPSSRIPTTSNRKAEQVQLPYRLDGMLQIDKIELNVPIIHGTTVEKLNIAPTTIHEHLSPGSVGNYVIAGHRSRKFGKNFNRLDELALGDTITIATEQRKWTYVVDRKHVVKPTDLSVLEPTTTGRELTLITCHPFGSNKFRLIIHAMIPFDE